MTERRWRPYLWLITTVSLFVPRRLRAEWRREWEAELLHREETLDRWRKKSGLNLLKQSTGSFRDALWLQTRRLEEDMFQDLRFGFRMLLKHPVFTIVIVLTLGLGIGANAAIFSVINAVLLRPLPYYRPEQLMQIGRQGEKGRQELDNISFPDFLDLRAGNESFSEMAVYRYWLFNLTGIDQPEALMGAVVSASLFPTLEVKPLYGRAFLPEEDRNGSRVVLVSYRLWQRRFGADPNLVGKQIRLGDAGYTVIGIMPPGFSFPPTIPTTAALPSRQIDLYVPPDSDPFAELDRRGSRNWLCVGRLKPDINVNQAAADLKLVSRHLEEQYSATNTNVILGVVPITEFIVGDLRPTLLVLLASVGVLLLIACSNVANLLLARVASRRKEMAIRAALGAGRLRLLRQLLTESMLLALIGGAVGLALSVWIAELLVTLSPEDIPRLTEVSLDSRVLLFTSAAALLTGLLFGLAPAVQVSKAARYEALKAGGGRSTIGGGGRRVRSALVVSQIALALVLLVGAGLLIRSFLRLVEVDPGFNPDRVLTTWVLLPNSKYKEPARQAEFFQRAVERIETLPGVESAGGVSSLPLTGMNSRSSLTIEGQPLPAPGKAPRAEIRQVTAHYFRTMGIALLAGREFMAQDTDHSPLVLIVNESFAQRHFAGENATGKRISLGGVNNTPVWREIVGVVRDVKHFGLESSATPEAYLPQSQMPTPAMVLVVRTAADPLAFTTAVQDRVQLVDKDQPVFNTRSMEQLVADSVARRRLNMILIGIFALLALVLATIGIYGVISYVVSQRTQEIGVRIALGAQRYDVLRLVIGEGMLLTLLGIMMGLIVSVAATHVLNSMFFNTSATDPLTYAGVIILLSGVSLLACIIPAWRATKVDPMTALRNE